MFEANFKFDKGTPEFPTILIRKLQIFNAPNYWTNILLFNLLSNEFT